jgi:endonuclease YncB( thermonuclease family)
VFKTVAAVAIVAASGVVAAADPMKPSEIYVVDGDTINALGERIRLVGFDAPELGEHAHCGLERMLAARATSRLRQMIQLSHDIDLQIVDCSCRPGTAGTMACNYGRTCGYLTVDGQDVGDALMAENLAHPLVLEILVSAAAIMVPAGTWHRRRREVMPDVDGRPTDAR